MTNKNFKTIPNTSTPDETLPKEQASTHNYLSIIDTRFLEFQDFPKHSPTTAVEVVFSYREQNLSSERYAGLFKAMGCETRLEILDYVLKNSDCNQNQVHENLKGGHALSNTSRHLGILVDARILTSRREGKSTYYDIHPDFKVNLTRFLNDLSTGTRKPLDRN